MIADSLEISRVAAPWLPENWLPAALPLIDRTGGRRRVFLHDPGGAKRPRSIDLAAEVVADPVRLSAALSRLLDKGRLAWIGPAADGGRVATVTAARPDGVRVTVVVIDQGIAAWHPALRHAAGPTFRGLLFLPPDGRPTPAGLIDAAGIADLAALADSGDMPALLARLVLAGPASLYAGTPALVHSWPGAVWHGTAVAATALTGAPPDVVAYGVELPDTATRDWSGAALQALLPAAITAALNLTASLADRPLAIVLPYAFTGSPLDGGHPAARVLGALLAAARAGGREVDMIVPAGNHRQDACRAETGGDVLRWHIPPDDFSANVIDLAAEDDPPSLTLTLPGGATAALNLDRGEVALMRHEGRVVAVAARPVTESFRLRIAVMPTGWHDAARKPAPFGQWRIDSGGANLEAVVLRDDRDPRFDATRPRRQSWLVDPGQAERGPDGAEMLQDPPGARVTRRGTLSVLATATGVTVVPATARWGGVEVPSAYSGLPVDGVEPADPWLVDDGWPDCGLPALAGSGPRFLRLSGTSMATGLAAAMRVRP